MDKDNVVVLSERRPEPPREPMCEISVYDNGDVTVWLGDYMETPEQFNWLLAKLASATGSVFNEKVARTAHE